MMNYPAIVLFIFIGIGPSLSAALLPANAGTITMDSGMNEEPMQEVRPLGLAHVALWTEDIERKVAFYRDFLGFPERQRGNRLSDGSKVYYLRDGEPESLAKETQGNLFMVKLRIGSEGQSIELFPARAPIIDGKSLYHFAVWFKDQEPVRHALLAIGAKAPTEPATKGFFTYDINSACTEILKSKPCPSTAANAGTNTLSIDGVSSHLLFVEIPGEHLADLKAFYIDTLNFAEGAHAAEGTDAADLTVRLDIGLSGEQVILNPEKMQIVRIGFEVESLDEALAFLEQNPWRANYQGPLEIETTDGQRHIVLEDPDGVRVELWERP